LINEELMAYRKDNQHRNYNKRDTRDYGQRTKKPDTNGAHPSHVSILPKGNEPIERTIKRFLRKCKKSGIIDEFRERQHYEKPSMKRRKRKLRREATLKKLNEKE
tara:strand:- start:244 stop:558 length:315 start_codon:yes stop_codon:yes gene_type:complete